MEGFEYKKFDDIAYHESIYCMFATIDNIRAGYFHADWTDAIKIEHHHWFIKTMVKVTNFYKPTTIADWTEIILTDTQISPEKVDLIRDKFLEQLNKILNDE